MAEHTGHSTKDAKKPRDTSMEMPKEMPMKGASGKPVEPDPHAGHDMSKMPKPGTSTKGAKK